MKDVVEAGPSEPLALLVAEPHPLHRAIACRLLEREMHRVHAAEHAGAALQVLRKESFDAILVDARLPGFEPDDVRVASRATDVALVALLPQGEPADREPWLEAGFDAVLVKPLRRADVALICKAAGASHDTGPDLRFAELVARARGSERVALEVAEIARETLPATLARLEAALQRGDAEAIEEMATAAHSIKGTVANFGASAARTAALRLEHAAREGDLERVNAEWPRLRTRVDELLAALAGLTAGASR